MLTVPVVIAVLSKIYSDKHRKIARKFLRPTGHFPEAASYKDSYTKTGSKVCYNQSKHDIFICFQFFGSHPKKLVTLWHN